jgi:hypothetical protein
MTRNKLIAVVVGALVAALVLSCKEINRQTSPVQLVVTTNQKLQRIDIAPNAANCDQTIGTVNIRAVDIQNASGNTPNLPTNTAFQDVKITSYHVSYVRTDGGTLVPAPFTRSISITVTPGASGQSTAFQGFQVDAFTQAPFVALLPNNGGRDPQTGRPVVQMDIILDVFGETLAGERVSGQTRVPLDFCYACNGCG